MFFLDKISTGLSNMRFTCLEEQFEEENFSEKNHFFSHFRTVNGAVSAFCQIIIRSVVKTAFYLSIGTIPGEDFLKNFFVTFGHWPGKIPLFLKKFSSDLSKLVSTCHKKIFEAKIILKKSFIFFVRTSIEKILAFCRKFFHRVVKTAFYVSMATFWFFLKFSDVGQKTIVIVWQTFPQGCQNCFPGVHRTKVCSNTFRWKPYIFVFRHWVEKFYFFLENCMAGLSELPSTRQ